MYYQIFHIGNIVFYILLAISFVLLLQKIIYHIVGLFPAKKFKDAKKNHKFAILIPARNESKVIEQLLISIEEQNYDHDLIKTYVIVESEDDPTCDIAKRYKNTEIFVRQHLENKGKGYALDEAVTHIFNSGEEFDAFFIFDADNILDKNYVSEMNKAFDEGYEIALGYRNSKNWNDGWVASASALTFSMVNTFQNKCRSRFTKNVIISGTGFYVSKKKKKKLGGWKFFELTEDYELSLYATINNVKATYNEYAEFYDEQPTKLKVSWTQRLRWVKGFSNVTKKYKKKLVKSFVVDKNNRLCKFEYIMSILPVVSILATSLLYTAFTLILGIVGSILGDPVCVSVYTACIISALVIYFFFVIYAFVMFLAERKHINIKLWNKIVCCFMFPLYMALYIPIYIQSIFKKEVEWKPIEHNVKMEKPKNN